MTHALFCPAEISQTMAVHAALLVSLERSQRLTRGAPTWIETVWSNSVEAIDY